MEEKKTQKKARMKRKKTKTKERTEMKKENNNEEKKKNTHSKLHPRYVDRRVPIMFTEKTGLRGRMYSEARYRIRGRGGPVANLPRGRSFLKTSSPSWLLGFLG